MSKFLDLRVYQAQTFDITLLDGSTIKINKPTQRIAIQMMALQTIQDKAPEEQLEQVVELISTILSHNTDNKKFSGKWVSETLDYTMMLALIQGYGEFMQEIQSNPNS